MNKIRELLNDHIVDYIESDMTTIVVDKSKLKKTLTLLKDNKDLQFTQLIDLCAVDYVEYGKSEWQTREATSTGYSRGIKPTSHSRIDFSDVTNEDDYEFAFNYNPLKNNQTELSYVKDVNGFDVKVSSNYSLMSAIPDYGATIEVLSTF